MEKTLMLERKRLFPALVLALMMILVVPLQGNCFNPYCEMLRRCSGDLAEAMVLSGGFRPEVIRQYRRNSVAPFEELGAQATYACRGTYEVVAKNALGMNADGRLDYVPKTCGNYTPEEFNATVGF